MTRHRAGRAVTVDVHRRGRFAHDAGLSLDVGGPAPDLLAVFRQHYVAVGADAAHVGGDEIVGQNVSMVGAQPEILQNREVEAAKVRFGNAHIFRRHGVTDSGNTGRLGIVRHA